MHMLNLPRTNPFCPRPCQSGQKHQLTKGYSKYSSLPSISSLSVYRYAIPVAASFGDVSQQTNEQSGKAEKRLERP